jgi:hypothetical protein
VSHGDQEYDTEYEAFYRLIHVYEADLYHWTTWCESRQCRVEGGGNWSVTELNHAGARERGLEHCREKHVRMVWSRDRW